MARKRQGKRNNPNQRGGHHAGARSSPAQSRNHFANLAAPDSDDDNINADLSERFAKTRFPDAANNSAQNQNPDGRRYLPYNNDIEDYYRKKLVTGGNWLDQPEIPRPEEVLRNDITSEADDLANIGHLQPYKIDGEYESKEDYLRTKYELLREDAIRPLREAIEEVRNSAPYQCEAEYSNHSIGIYDSVYITALVLSPRGLATRVQFTLNRVRKHVRWNQSKRLITGTLVALTPDDDNFETQCVLAVVAARPVSALQQNPPEIDLFFAPGDQQIDPMRKWIMVESRASFFEGSRYTLSALQHMMRERFPMSEHLVNVQKEVDAPKYIQDNPRIDLSSLVSMEESADFKSVDVMKDWPESSSHSLDKSQSKALKRMLIKKLAVIQGPPGTGKTYVSVNALRILCENLRDNDPPIVVTAQTNHAVDQILRHTMEFEPNFVRLGGRSKDEDIKKRTLFEIRAGFNAGEIPKPRSTGQGKNALKAVTKRIQDLLLPIESNRPPLDHMVLLRLGLLTEKQVDSLIFESQGMMGMSVSQNPGILIEQWLGRCLSPCTRPVTPNDYDLGFEEEDYEVEQLQELEAEAVQDDEDLDALRGPVVLLSDNFRGRGESTLTNEDIRKLLSQTDDLTTINTQDRGHIYDFFLREVKKLLLQELRKMAIEYEAGVLVRKVGLWNDDLQILRDNHIIGCTTTGLSKYRALLTALRPRVVLVEEAAETQEAPVTAACLPSLEHLILVGDHLQLRPHCQVHEFEDAPFFLNMSLFERLVRNEVEFDTLTRQRRMIPEIRRLLRPIYLNTLKDHESVKDAENRPPVEGMGGNNSFFFCHEWPESRDNNMSALNSKEGDMVVSFCDYLVLNGVDASKITVLTFYNGQRKYIARKIREHANLRSSVGIKVVTVDSYQGEENDIVLLSLVRSNSKHSIGFLSSDNRACVALSRAKRGFFLFGNAEMLACGSIIWGEVIEIMYGLRTKINPTTGQARRLGYYLPLQCTNHGAKVWMEEPEDFDCIKGGCDQDCGGSLPCGHKCLYRCHPFDHSMINCTQMCSKVVSTCGHSCTEMCCDACKCQRCDRRGNGQKSLLKPNVQAKAGYRGPPRDTHWERGQNPGHLGLPALSIPPDSSSIASWEMYANGGAQLDDARVLRKRQEKEERFAESIRNHASQPGSPHGSTTRTSSQTEKIVEVSPDKVPRSRNTELLVDLDDAGVHSDDTRKKGSGPKNGTDGGPLINLLD